MGAEGGRVYHGVSDTFGTEGSTESNVRFKAFVPDTSSIFIDVGRSDWTIHEQGFLAIVCYFCCKETSQDPRNR